MSRWTVLETLGLALVVTFFGLLWWPAALLVAGVLLVLAAQVGERRDATAAAPESEGA